MLINADKPHLWKADTRASVDQFNRWFMKFAPKAYRDTRKKTIESVEQGLTLTKDLLTITPDVLKTNPGILPTLRMSTCPPLARDRIRWARRNMGFGGRRRRASSLVRLPTLPVLCAQRDRFALVLATLHRPSPAPTP